MIKNTHGGANRNQGRKKLARNIPVRVSEDEKRLIDRIRHFGTILSDSELNLISYIRSQRIFLYIDDMLIIKQMGLEFCYRPKKNP